MTIEDEPLTLDYLVVEFPGGTMAEPGLALLTDLVDGGGVRVVDLVFIRREDSGSVSIVDAAELGDSAQFDLGVLDGLHTGRLSALDVAAAGAHIHVGSAAGVIVLETSPETPAPPLVAQRAPRRRSRGPR